jgi:broad specificity phosphatase PhoE
MTRQFFMRTISRLAFFSVNLVMFAPTAHGQAVRTIYLVRHADKISEDTDAPLSDAGRRRAECLAATLADSHIDKIYVSDLQRTWQTAAPLATRLQLKPVTIPLSKPAELIAALRSEKAANVLVVWHGTTLPSVLRAIGGPDVPPIANTEYDRFYILTVDAQKASTARFTALRYCVSAN